MIALPVVSSFRDNGFSLKKFNPTVFLDDDATTIFDATSGGVQGGPVARWENKGANVNPALQATVGSRPTYGADGILSDGVDDELVIADSGVLSTGDFTFLVLHRFVQTSGVWNAVMGCKADTTTGAAGEMFIQRRGNNFQIGCHNTGRQDVGVHVITPDLAAFTSWRLSILRRSGGFAAGNGSTLYVASNNLTSTGTQTWGTDRTTTTLRFATRQGFV